MWAITLLIVMNVVAFIASTVTWVEQDPELVLLMRDFEIFSVILFAIEWLLRLWCAPEEREYSGWLGRLRFVGSFYSVVDLCAILPTAIDPFIGNFVGVYACFMACLF
jgi:voltage-gated potassium channel